MRIIASRCRRRYVLDLQDRARKHIRAKPQPFTVVRVDMDIDTGIR
jgi:hypothetical protein